MDFDETQDRFVRLWGTVGVEWGINRTMAQIHALLLTVHEPMSTDDVIRTLSISRGNANMNLRELLAWGLVYRESIPGDRKDYFFAEKDVWEIAQKIVTERKKRELDPMMKILEQLLHESSSQDFGQDIRFKEFHKVMKDLYELGKKSSALLDLLLRVDQSAFFKPIKSLFKGGKK